MEFEIFGRMGVRQDGREAALSGRLQRVLLGALLARANTAVTADALADAMWGEDAADRAASRLHVHVHRLRRALPQPDRLISEPGGYRLTVLPGELDAERFETLAAEGAEARANDPHTAAELIRKALALWTGEPFAGLDCALVGAEAHRLSERRLAALEALYTAELACGRHAAVAAELAAHVRRHPLHERLSALLMIALARSGQQSRALAAYQAARRALIDELGQEPGPELRRIERTVLAGEEVDDAAAVAPQVPAQLPADIRGFTGRDGELGALRQLLDDRGAPVALISGGGGVGKTALAVRWAHRAAGQFPDGQLYVDLRGFGPDPAVPPEDALAGLLRGLGVDSAAIPSGLAERAARFRTLVAGRRMLVLLDNAATAEQVRPLLPGGSTARTLVTSRAALPGLVARDGAARFPLDRLAPHAALELLAAFAGDRVRDEPDAAAELVRRCSHLPLAVRVAAELVNARPRRPLSAFAAELADEQHALDALDAGGDAATSVRSVLSWSYRELPSAEARTFRLLGLLPGHDADVPAIAALTGDGRAATARRLAALERASLADEVGDGRYALHDLLRAYARDRAAETETAAERAAALTRLHRHAVESAAAAAGAAHGALDLPGGMVIGADSGGRSFATPADALRWLDAERPNLAGAARSAAAAGEWRTAVELACVLRRYLSLGGHHDDALEVYAAALEAAQQLGDPFLVATGQRCIGSVHRRLGHLDLALDYMRRSYSGFGEVGCDRDQRIQLIQLGVLAIFRGRYSEAEESLAEILAASGGEALEEHIPAHAYLGQLLYLKGDLERALHHSRSAVELAGRGNPRQRIDGEAVTGWVFVGMGRHGEAVDQLERARSMAQQARNRFIEAYVHPLAHAYWGAGQQEAAVDAAESCLAVAISGNERLVEPSARNTLGEIRLRSGDPEAALAQHRTAARLASGIGIRYCFAQANAGIGDALAELGDLDSARSHWRIGADVFRGIGASAADAVESRLSASSPAGSAAGAPLGAGFGD